MNPSMCTSVRVNIIRKRDQSVRAGPCQTVHVYRMRLSFPRADISLLTDDRRGCVVHVHGICVTYVREIRLRDEWIGSDRNGLDIRLRFSLSMDRYDGSIT